MPFEQYSLERTYSQIAVKASQKFLGRIQDLNLSNKHLYGFGLKRKPRLHL